MSKFPFDNRFKAMWNNLAVDGQKPLDIIYLVFLGMLVGLCAGGVIAIFRITVGFAYGFIIQWSTHTEPSIFSIGLWFAVAIMAALLVGWLGRNQAIRFGGAAWILDALADGQSRPWLKILLPKFVGSWLVLALGISVGSEGPCIEMGAATSLGIKNLDTKNFYERRYFILGGCAAGLAAAFSAPFAGICYVYEIMKENISRTLFVFLFAGSLGVYLSTTMLFGLDVMLPMGKTPMPGLAEFWLIVPLAVFSGLVGIVYNYLLRISKCAYGRQKKVPAKYEPLFAFIGAAIMVLAYPAITGEGLTIFSSINSGHMLFGMLCLFMVAKLLFTAFCYGAAIPAGLMVPVICLGGVSGAMYGEWLIALGLMDASLAASCMVMGMAGAFSAAERAPITGLVLVAEMTAAYTTVPGILVVAAIGAFMARLAKVKAV